MHFEHDHIQIFPLIACVVCSCVQLGHVKGIDEKEAKKDLWRIF